MTNWNINWKFDKQKYMPDNSGYVKVWLRNTGETPFTAGKVGIQFDWQDDHWYAKESGVFLSPQEREYFSYVDFSVPENVVGVRSFRFGVEEREYSPYSGWGNPDIHWTDWEDNFGIDVSPLYRCFVSRSIHGVDKPTVDPFNSVIRKWGLNTFTVGLNVLKRPEELVKEVVKREIEMSDCLVGIATRRFLAQVNGFAWKPFEWLSYEASVADGLNKPVLIIRDEDLVLPSFLSDFPSISFNSYNLKKGLQKINDYIPILRNEIKKKKGEEGWSNLKKLATGGLLVLAGIGIGKSLPKN